MDQSQEHCNHGLSGLVNLGNTCYVNSVLQVLSHIQEFNEYISTYVNANQESKNMNQISILKEWNDLNDLLWHKNVIISPKRFLKVIQGYSKMKNNENFSGYDQNDSTEFLYFLFDIMHEEMKNKDASLKSNVQDKWKKLSSNKSFQPFVKKKLKSDFSIIDELFSGVCETTILDENENHISHSYQSFVMMDLPLVDTDLIPCIDEYFRDDELNAENENQYFDDTDNTYKDVTKQMRLIRSPHILIIHLKRWNANLRKNQRIIHYPHQLNMTPYIKSSNGESAKECTYELFAINNHSGNVFGGHYFSYIKNGNKWYTYNDTEVSMISESKLSTNKNYVLYYRKNQQ